MVLGDTLGVGGGSGGGGYEFPWGERLPGMSFGRSYVANYCNFVVPIPYCPEPYNLQIVQHSVVNYGTGTIANIYAKASTYFYFRVKVSGIPNGSVNLCSLTYIITRAE